MLFKRARIDSNPDVDEEETPAPPSRMDFLTTSFPDISELLLKVAAVVLFCCDGTFSEPTAE